MYDKLPELQKPYANFDFANHPKTFLFAMKILFVKMEIVF